MSEMNIELTPDRPDLLKVDLQETSSTVTLTYRTRNWGTGCFLLVWLSFWTVGCVVLACAVWVKPEVHTILFGIPFWASWFFVLGLVLSMLAKREQVTFDAVGLAYSRSILFPTFTRTVPLAELQRFENSATTNSEENDNPVFHVELVTMGQPLLMFAGLSNEEREWLTWRLNQHLHRLNELYHPQPVDIPSDCTWEVEELYDATVFRQHGRLRLVPLAVTLFVNLFWNSIVLFFILMQFGMVPGAPQVESEQASMGLFLVPFALIGVAMIGVLIYVLLEPFRRTILQIDRNEVQFGSRRLGLGWIRRYDTTSITKIGIESRSAADGSVRSSILSLQTTASRQSDLRLSNDDNRTVLQVSGLTEGEARWMLRQIQQIHPHWVK